MKCIVCLNKKEFKPLSPDFCKASNYLCLVCGLVFIPKNRDSATRYYKKDGYFIKSPNLAYRKQLISKSLLIKEAAERIKSALSIFPVELKSKSVLDIGCNKAEILEFLPNVSYYGIDINKKVIDEIKNILMKFGEEGF